ncbi:MAG: hypothetical protein HY326_04175 [Chloroflexi bacterium]|nr:hypothetical protein [Chloroflexota bacterium]
MKIVQFVFIGITGLILLFGAAVLGVVLLSSRDADPTTTLPATATVTGVATVPTPATAVPAIAAAAAATATSMLASAATGGSSDADLLYNQEIRDTLAAYIPLLAALNEHFSAASNNSSLLKNDYWRVEVTREVAALKTNDAHLRSLTPPAQFKDAQAELLQMANHYDATAALTANVLDTASTDQLLAVIKEMNLGVTAMQQAAAKLK